MISKSSTTIILSPHDLALTVSREPGNESAFNPRIVLSYNYQFAEFAIRLTSREAMELRNTLDLVIDKSLCD